MATDYAKQMQRLFKDFGYEYRPEYKELVRKEERIGWSVFPQETFRNIRSWEEAAHTIYQRIRDKAFYARWERIAE